MDQEMGCKNHHLERQHSVLLVMCRISYLKAQFTPGRVEIPPLVSRFFFLQNIGYAKVKFIFSPHFNETSIEPATSPQEKGYLSKLEGRGQM